MSTLDDDRDVNPRRDLDDRTAEALLSGRAVEGQEALSGFVSDLLAMRMEAPAPSAALAAMLEAGLGAGLVVDPLAVAPAQRAARSSSWTRRAMTSWKAGRRSWALPLQAGLAAAGCVVLLLGAAAANSLPDPVQTAVADVVDAVTPIELPRPARTPITPQEDLAPGVPVDDAGSDALNDSDGVADEHEHGLTTERPEDSSGRGGDDHSGPGQGSGDDRSGSGSDGERKSSSDDSRSSGSGESGSSGSGSDGGGSRTTDSGNGSDAVPDSSGSGSSGSGETSGSSGSGSGSSDGSGSTTPDLSAPDGSGSDSGGSDHPAG